MTSFHQKTSQTENLEHFKSSMNDWVIFLGKELREARLQINGLQKRIEQLEMDPRMRF